MVKLLNSIGKLGTSSGENPEIFSPAALTTGHAEFNTVPNLQWALGKY